MWFIICIYSVVKCLFYDSLTISNKRLNYVMNWQLKVLMVTNILCCYLNKAIKVVNTFLKIVKNV